MQSDHPPPRPVHRDAVVAAALVALIALKLWLVHSEEIAGSATQHDALWFVRSASVWYWGAKYDWTAFIRPPAYPLWLALVHWCAVPQRLAIELLQLFGFATLTLALLRAGLSRLIAVSAFALAAFHPAGIHLNDYTMADPFYAGVLPWLLAGMISLLARGRTSVAVGTGFALAVLWLTREESVLVGLLLGAFLLLWAAHERLRLSSWRAAASNIARPSAVMLAVFAVLVLAVYTANQRTFRAFAKSDMVAPSFEGAFNALVRIKPSQHQRFVPVPNESLHLAFAASPTFAKLQPRLDGADGEAWRIGTFRNTGVQGEIGINWLLWAIRHAASGEGIHDTPKRAEHFYRGVARELNAAFAEGRLESRVLWASFIGPNLIPEAHQLGPSLRRLLGLFVARHEMAPLVDDEILLPEEARLYDQLTLRVPGGARNVDPADVAERLKRTIGATYRVVVFALIAAGAIAGMTLLRPKNRLRLPSELDCALVLLFCAIVTRLALFTVIDATSWPVAYDRFLFPIMPLSSIFLVALVYRGTVVLRATKSA
ncbi:MAG: hypothetical protein M3Y69_07315 [Verrucomicrobiota bacterium]|nr:hypothetical protein [Verrucomicrobiota bacterium]